MHHHKLINKIIEEYKIIAFSSISDFVYINKDNQIELKHQQINSAVAQINSTQNKYGSSVKIKMHNKLTALKFLAQHLGLLKSNSPSFEDIASKLEELSPTEIKKIMHKLAIQS